MNVFFQKEELACEDYSQALVDLLDFKGQFDLCLDRSNWKFGQKHVNYLVLSWRICDELSLPLFMVDLNKAGNSNTNERLDLLERFGTIFGFNRIKSLIADREFIGQKWFVALHQKGIPFFMRIKENMLTPFGQDTLTVGRYFNHLNPKQNRKIYKTMYGLDVCLSGTCSKDNELVIVMTNQDLKASEILRIYKKRWSIEELFRKLKSSGFDLEKSHMTDPKRLVSLLIILGMATLVAYLAGKQVKIPFKQTVNYLLKSPFRQGLSQLRFYFAKSLKKTISWILKLLDAAKTVINKSDG